MLLIKSPKYYDNVSTVHGSKNSRLLTHCAISPAVKIILCVTIPSYVNIIFNILCYAAFIDVY